MDCKWYDISCISIWWVEEIKALSLYIFNSILSGFASVVEAIPVPEFLLNIGNFTLPNSILFYVNLFELPVGIGIIVAAYTARFVLRRIPLIG